MNPLLSVILSPSADAKLAETVMALAAPVSASAMLSSEATFFTMMVFPSALYTPDVPARASAWYTAPESISA